MANCGKDPFPRDCRSSALHFFLEVLLTRTISDKLMEVGGQNRSVMPFDVLGRTRATLIGSTSIQPFPKGMGNLLKPDRDRDR